MPNHVRDDGRDEQQNFSWSGFGGGGMQADHSAGSSGGAVRAKRRMPWHAIYRVAIVAFTVFVLLDTFVIPRSYAVVQSSSSGSSSSTSSSSSSSSSGSSSDNATVTSNSYTNGDTSITITTDEVDGTTVYVADIYCYDITTIQTALANSTYGKNVTETVSDQAEDNNAILAINGDYYGAQNAGYVIRNGVIYRDTAASDDQEDLVIYSDGSFEVIEEGDYTAQDLLDKGAWQVFSFGPGLIENGSISVSESDEVDKAMTSNPRTAIGEISDGHYVMVVADGRTSESQGLTLYQLAEYMKSFGCTAAYNLDGGGSSTMYFNGEVINNPTGGGNSGGERKVSDIVYIAE